MRSGEYYRGGKTGGQMQPRRFAAVICMFFLLSALDVGSRAQSLVPEPIHGVTVDDKNDIRDGVFLAKLLDSLRHLSVKPAVRIVTESTP